MRVFFGTVCIKNVYSKCHKTKDDVHSRLYKLHPRANQRKDATTHGQYELKIAIQPFLHGTQSKVYLGSTPRTLLAAAM
jgi:hypothetical protein